MGPKKLTDSTTDQKAVLDALILDYPPDPPPIDRTTKLLAKICGVLLILVGISFIWDRYRTPDIVPSVEPETSTNIDSRPKKYGFPVMGEFKESLEPVPAFRPKISKKPKTKLASKKPAKKPIKRQRMVSSK